MPSQRIVVAGAGSIGCFVGGLLLAAGRDVGFLGRERLISQVSAAGLTLTDFAGLDVRVAPDMTDDPKVLRAAGVVLVCVKTGATGDIAARIAEHAPPDAVIVSLQNGVQAVAALRAALPGREVRAGMVPFNVVPKGPGHFHRAVSGDILIGTGRVPLDLSAPGLRISESPDITAIQWGKLVINLNNALNALSGQTVHDQLLSRDWRSLMADQMAEALAVLRAAGIRVKSTTPVPARLIPAILRLPTPLFRRIAAQMLTVDPAARTSMAYDLDAGRPTEIAALQGEIVSLANRAGVDAAISAAVMDLIRAAGAAGTAPQPMTASEIRDRLHGS